jgi:hypothetical protein
MTLFTTPVVYLFFDRLRGRFAALSKKGAKHLEPVPETVAGD